MLDLPAAGLTPPPGEVSPLVEHHQRLAAHMGVALDHMHIAAEGRNLVLVANLERRGWLDGTG